MQPDEGTFCAGIFPSVKSEEFKGGVVGFSLSFYTAVLRSWLCCEREKVCATGSATFKTLDRHFQPKSAFAF